MNESLKNEIKKNNDIENDDDKNIANTKLLTNIAINKSLVDKNIENDKNNFENSIDNNVDQNLKAQSSIIDSMNSKDNTKRINISLKEGSTYSKKVGKGNYSYLNRFIDYEKRKENKLSQMQKEKKEKERKTLKNKPFISRKSIELINKLKLNDDLLERMNDEEKKKKDKKEKLIEKINTEREKKKKEIEQPNKYNIKITKFDNKFDKIYSEMMKKNELLKSKINAFSDMVKEYEMRECFFQPNYFKNNDKNDSKTKKKRRVSSCEVTQRLYNDEIKNRRKKADKLNEKYKLSFHPTISNKSIDLALRKRERMKYSSKENIGEENINMNEENME